MIKFLIILVLVIFIMIVVVAGAFLNFIERIIDYLPGENMGNK